LRIRAFHNTSQFFRKLFHLDFFIFQALGTRENASSSADRTLPQIRLSAGRSPALA